MKFIESVVLQKSRACERFVKKLVRLLKFESGLKMAAPEDYEIDLDSNASSVFGDGKKQALKLKYRLTVSPHLKGKYKPKRIEAEDTAEFFLKVMKIKQEDMVTINWSMRKLTWYSFIITMHLNDPSVFDKANFKYVVNGCRAMFGQEVQGSPRWFATFETSNDKSGVAFIVQKPLSKGLTKANKFELCAQLRKRHELASDMYDVKHVTDNPTLAESASDDWLFFALFQSAEFEYPLFTSGPIPFNLDGKTVFLTLRRKENLQQLEERLKLTNKSEAEIKAILTKRRTEMYLSNAKLEQKLEKATIEEARTRNAVSEIAKINVVEPTLNKKEYLTIMIQQAQTKFEKDRFTAKRAIILREEEKQRDKDYFKMMRDSYDIENASSKKWRALMTNSMRMDLILFMRTYDEKSKVEDQRVQDQYEELYGHLDENLEIDFEKYNQRAQNDLPFSPINPTPNNPNSVLESTQNEKTLQEEMNEARGLKRPRVVPPENLKDKSQDRPNKSKNLSKNGSKNGSVVSDNNDNEVGLDNTHNRFMQRYAAFARRDLPQNAPVLRASEVERAEYERIANEKAREEEEDLRLLESQLLATPTPKRTIGRRATMPDPDKFRKDMEDAHEDNFNNATTAGEPVDFIRDEVHHEAGPHDVSFRQLDLSPPKLAGNSRKWGNWNKRRWPYFLLSQESDGINCLRHNMEWRKDNVMPFLGRILSRNNAKDHVNNFYKLLQIAGSDRMPEDQDEFLDMKAALYFLGPRNVGAKAHFSRENLESLDVDETKRMPGKLIDVLAIKRSPPKVDTLVPLWIQAMTLLDESERHSAWSYGATKIGIYARPHLDSQGTWRLLSGHRWLQFLKHPQDAIGTNIVGDPNHKDLGDPECFS